MLIRLNGKPSETNAESIAELLQEIQAPQIGIAVALNGQVVRRTEQAVTTLQENDEVEIIRAVQGG